MRSTSQVVVEVRRDSTTLARKVFGPGLPDGEKENPPLNTWVPGEQ
jgi:hypothetical protein